MRLVLAKFCLRSQRSKQNHRCQALEGGPGRMEVGAGCAVVFPPGGMWALLFSLTLRSVGGSQEKPTAQGLRKVLDPGLGSTEVRVGLAVWMAEQDRKEHRRPALPPPGVAAMLPWTSRGRCTGPV